MILSIHTTYLLQSDVTGDGAQGTLINVLPLVIFGFGHALFTTVQESTVPKLVKDKNQIANTLTILKISESIGITFF